MTEIRPGTYVFNDRNALLSGEGKHYGYIQGHAEYILEDLSEEHGHLAIPDDAVIRLGDRLRVIPNHVCPGINLHSQVYPVSGDQVIGRWKVPGRGMVT